MTKNLIAQIDNLLPQTQCKRCDYVSCLAYATAIATKNERINKCIPGGPITMQAISQTTHRPLDPITGKGKNPSPKTTAKIDETRCIGCTKCIQACPVDAILGAKRCLHTVLTSECTGCKLCLAPCPTDCITFSPLPHSPPSWIVGIEDKALLERARKAKERFLAKNIRIAQTNQESVKQHQALDTQRIRLEIQEAIQRAKQKKKNEQDQTNTNL